MSDLLKGREFQLWEYRVSHGSLLIRSPRRFPGRPGISDVNVDIICIGVVYVAAPRFLGEIAICSATEAELADLRERLPAPTMTVSSVWVLQSAVSRSLIVAAGLTVREYAGDIFDSPFSI
jgi:hypothetical protein